MRKVFVKTALRMAAASKIDILCAHYVTRQYLHRIINKNHVFSLCSIMLDILIAIESA